MGERVSASGLSKQGKSLYLQKKYIEAAKLFEAARCAYLDAGDDLNAADMANNAAVAYLQAGLADQAFKSVDGTAEIFAGAGDLKREGMALGNLAAAMEALERNDDAMTTYQRSAEVLLQAGDDQMRAFVMESLSMLQFRKGKQIQALASMQDGLEHVKHPSPKQALLKKLLNLPLQMANRSRRN